MKRLTIAASIASVAVIAAVTAIIADGLNDRTGPADVAVVLGSKVMPDGTPSPRLKARLDRGVELYRDNRVAFVLVSGGTGKEGFSEGLVMRDYTVAQGVPRDRVIMDEFGNTTRATAENAARMMQARGLTTAIAVSQYFHITRTRMALNDAGIGQAGSAHARIYELRDLYSIAREIPGVITYWLGSR
ncbi:vancomycin permeability regulator SanA [Neorhizobium huautlense]|uniref:Vancomycin permeability regulator SanA n=1 Tax=Neorhizobium huautlense TaxID=67774 RepID=A0ABT9PUI7_9HYPH|nr:YdcF family protein [Neorhizobium huautlense]MDP9838136.1 vancomycin permeability regulator SanA [Neorhizobium huautlense]